MNFGIGTGVFIGMFLGIISIYVWACITTSDECKDGEEHDWNPWEPSPLKFTESKRCAKCGTTIKRALR